MKYPLGTKIQSKEKRNSDRFYAIVDGYEEMVHALGKSKTYTLQWYNVSDNSASSRTKWYEANIDKQLMVATEYKPLDEDLFRI